MSDITYILGAGASCKAMPLVSNFPERFNVFAEYIESEPAYRGKLLTEVKFFQNSINSHLSFDTFFKKLFHQDEDPKIILNYKSLLLLFFLFEHLFERKYMSSNRTFRIQAGEKRQKDLNLDPRYEALIAGLLLPKRGKTEFPTNINFFTWNYDANLIYALKNFIAPHEKYTDFIDCRRNEEYLKISDQIKVFHLNGFIYHPLLNGFNQEDSFVHFPKLLSNYANDESIHSFSENIKFSWEQEDIKNETFETAIKNSSTIILIGYSLPLYNRSIDTSLLKYSNLSRKTMFIQDMNPQNIAEILESDFNFSILEKSRTMESPKVKLSDNCNSFIVPNIIYNLKHN